MSVPFHKQTDPAKQAGQIVFSPSAPNTSEQYLHQYIAKKDDNPKRITFDEWFTDTYSNPDDEVYYWSRRAWDAALKNGKVS